MTKKNKVEKYALVCKKDDFIYMRLVLESIDMFSLMDAKQNNEKNEVSIVLDLTKDQYATLERLNWRYKNDKFNNGNLFEIRRDWALYI